MNLLFEVVILTIHFYSFLFIFIHFYSFLFIFIHFYSFLFIYLSFSKDAREYYFIRRGGECSMVF